MTTGERMKSRRKELGIPVDQVAAALNVSVATVYRYEKGDIEKVPGAALEPLAKILHTSAAWLMGWCNDEIPLQPESRHSIPPGFEPMPKMKKVPLVGNIACGEPITAEENIEDYVDVPEEYDCDFSLRCRGDSMVDVGISDGDIVYIHAQAEVNDGQIAAVRIGDEATLKRVYWDGETLTLIPENRSLRPMTYTGAALREVHIEGRAVGFTHWF